MKEIKSPIEKAITSTRLDLAAVRDFISLLEEDTSVITRLIFPFVHHSLKNKELSIEQLIKVPVSFAPLKKFIFVGGVVKVKPS